MIDHANPTQSETDWCLPEGCRFHTHPEYALEYKGRGYYPSPTEAKVLMILLSNQHRAFSGKEIAEILYRDRKDGGPEWAVGVIAVLIYRIKVGAHRAGIELTLRGPLNQYGYRLYGIRLAESPLMSLRRLGFVPRNERVIQGVVRKAFPESIFPSDRQS